MRHWLSFLTLVLLIHSSACVEGGHNRSEPASDFFWDGSWQENELEMLNEVNQYRAAGAFCADQEMPPQPPLELDTTIQRAARLHSEDMGAQNYFSHDALDGRDPFQRMEDVGFTGAFPWGENLQAGSKKAKDAVEGLMGSPGHCLNIMSPEFKVMGVGYAHNPESDYKHYWTQNFAASH